MCKNKMTMDEISEEYLRKFAKKNIASEDLEEMFIYIRSQFHEDELDRLIDFYHSLSTKNETAANQMLNEFVDSYYFLYWGYGALSVDEKCAEKVFKIPFNDHLINLFGRVAMEMIDSNNPVIRSKAFEMIKVIGQKDIPQEELPYENGVDELATTWATGRFCLLTYGKALFRPGYEEYDPLKGLNILFDFVCEGDVENNLQIEAYEYFDYLEEAYDYCLKNKDYDLAFRVLYDEISYCDDPLSYAEQQVQRIHELRDLIQNAELDDSKYDWDGILEVWSMEDKQ